MKFTILVNQTTAHISTGLIREGASDETMNRCSAVTKGNLATRGKAHENGADALKAARNARGKVCKTCVKVVEEAIAAEAACNLCDGPRHTGTCDWMVPAVTG